METVLAPTDIDPLKESVWRCAGGMPAPAVARLVEGRLEVDDSLPERLRASLTALPHDERPARLLLSPAAGVDPFGPDPYVQSCAFLTAAAALEAGVEVALVTRGVPARGFNALFRRYPGQVVAHVAVTLPSLEPPGAAGWHARVGAIAALSSAGARIALRLDPAVPSRTDSEAVLAEWIGHAAAAGALSVVVAPLVLDDTGRTLVNDEPAILDYYRPGRRRRRGVPLAPPAPHLPLERETALVWRVRQVCEDHMLSVQLCRCARAAAGSCGLAVRRAERAPQMKLWA